MSKLTPGSRDEARRRILAEAFAIFLEKGLEGTKMDDIAARLNVTKPAIYRYFKNKEELFVTAVAEQVINEFQQTLTASFASDDLLAGGSVFFDAIVEKNRKYAAIFIDTTCIIIRNESLQSGISEYSLEFIAKFEQFFNEQKEMGRIHPDIDTRYLAVACNALIQGLTQNVMTGMDPSEAKRAWLTVFAKLLEL